MSVRDLLIALLRLAIKGEAIDVSAVKESLNDECVATLFTVAKKHDVAHLVCYGLEKCGIELKGELWKAFLTEKEKAILRYDIIKTDTQEICACFDQEKIDYIPLKGAVIRQYYPQPWMRTSCDIDILVHDEDLSRAVDELVNNQGYRVEGEKSYHDISLYSPFGTHLELHHNIKENEPKYDKLLTQDWGFSNKSEGNKYLQTNEFLMLHLIAHMAYHITGGGCGLRSVLDIWILRRELKLNEAKLNELLEECGLVTFYNSIVALGECWLDNGCEAQELIKELEMFILLGGAYGTKRLGAISKQVKKGGKGKYFMSRIFMPYESLCVLYPVIKKHKILTPFCQVARWFGALKKGKSIKKEINNVSNATEEQVDNTRELFNKLGL